MPTHIAIHRNGRLIVIRTEDYPAYYAAGWRLI